MSKKAEVCSASGRPLTEQRSTAFPCPSCGVGIGRSARCRNQGVPYVCPGCGFKGP